MIAEVLRSDEIKIHTTKRSNRVVVYRNMVRSSKCIDYISSLQKEGKSVIILNYPVISINEPSVRNIVLGSTVATISREE